MLRVVRIFVLMPLFAQAAYDLRISYTGDKNAPTTIKTQYCKGTTIKCGKQTKVSSNGVLLFKAYYENGEYEGEVLSYYNDGSLQERRTYNKGKEEGKRVFYYPNGKIQSEQEYVSNKREGEGKTYYENGVLRAEFTYKNDRLHGIRQDFNKAGALVYATLYKDGKKQAMQQYNAKGEVIDTKDCRWQACY